MSINESEPSKPEGPGAGETEERELRSGTVPTGHGPAEPDAQEDVLSDPALDDRLGSDWADEGGAVPSGPATDAPAAPAGTGVADPKRTALADGDGGSEE